VLGGLLGPGTAIETVSVITDPVAEFGEDAEFIIRKGVVVLPMGLWVTYRLFGSPVINNISLEILDQGMDWNSNKRTKSKW
jgi:hypothetical protein